MKRESRQPWTESACELRSAGLSLGAPKADHIPDTSAALEFTLVVHTSYFERNTSISILYSHPSVFVIGTPQAVDIGPLKLGVTSQAPRPPLQSRRPLLRQPRPQQLIEQSIVWTIHSLDYRTATTRSAVFVRTYSSPAKILFLPRASPVFFRSVPLACPA